MPQITLLAGHARAIDGAISDDRLLVDPDTFRDALGWELKPEGLCRENVCVPVRDRDAITAGDDIDLVAAARLIGRPTVLDAQAGTAAVALESEQRRRAVESLEAPDFTLNDLDGTPHALSDWRGSKKLLVAFASW
jgi:hypothetical protein